MKLEEFLTEEQLSELNWRKALATGALAAATATSAFAQGSVPDIDLAKISQQEKAEQQKIDALPKPTTPEELRKYLRKIDRIRNGLA